MKNFDDFGTLKVFFDARMDSDLNGDGLDGTSTPKIGLYICKRVRVFGVL